MSSRKRTRISIPPYLVDELISLSEQLSLPPRDVLIFGVRYALRHREEAFPWQLELSETAAPPAHTGAHQQPISP